MALTLALALLAALALAGPAVAGPFDQLDDAAGCYRPFAVPGCTEIDTGQTVSIVASGTHVYVSYTNNRINVFDRNPSTGQLTLRPPSPAGCIEEPDGGSGCTEARRLAGPSDMAISPDGTRLYVVLSDGVSALTRDPATGNLTQADSVQSCVTTSGNSGDCGTSPPMITAPTAVAVSPDGQDVYVTGGNGSGSDWVTLLDVAGGGIQQHPESSGGCAQTPVSGNPPTTGCLVAGALRAPTGLAVSPDGRHVYVTTFVSSGVSALARGAGGELTVVPGMDGCIQPSPSDDLCREDDDLAGELWGPAFAGDTRLYVGGGASGQVRLLHRDPATGGLTDGPCARDDGMGPCADSANLFGVRDIVVTPDRSALVVGARFEGGMHLMRLGADGAPLPVMLPEGCLATRATMCTLPRGYTTSFGDDFGGNAIALAGPFVYGQSVDGAEDGAGIVAARRALFNPACTDASVDVAPGQEVSLPLNCADGDDDPIVRDIVSAPGQGSLGSVDQGSGRVAYTAPPEAAGTTQTVNFRAIANGANSGSTNSNAATVTIRVAPVPPADPPPDLPTAVVTQTIEADRDRDGIPDSQDTSDASAGPQLAQTAVVQVVSGDVFVRRPAGKPRSAGRAAQAPGTPAGFVPVKGAEIVPVGSVVHTLRGRIALTSVAQVVRGRRQTQRANFFDGIFQIKQARARRPVTELALRSNFAGVCGANPRAARGGPGATAAQQRSSRRVSRLWGDGRGRFRSRGRYSSATVRGTRWLTEDRCNGTLTRVGTGSVTVRDFTARRTVTVRAGGRYLARAQRATARRRR